MVSNHISQVGVEVCRCGVQHASTTGIAAAVCNAYRNKEYVATLYCELGLQQLNVEL